VKLIADTRTKKSLEIRSILDENIYEKGIKITDDETLSQYLSQIKESYVT
jgi:hypothetical protein